MWHPLRGGSTFHVRRATVTLVAATVLLCMPTLEAQVDFIEQDSPPTTQQSPWRDFLFSENDARLSTNDSAPFPPTAKLPSTTPSTAYSSIPSSIPFRPRDHPTKAPGVTEDKQATAKRAQVALPDPALYLNFSLTLGQVHDPNASVYQTVHHLQDRPATASTVYNSSSTEAPYTSTDAPELSSTRKDPMSVDPTRRPLHISTARTPNIEDDVVLNVPRPNQHPCHRECVSGAPPMKCRYFFVQEWYQTMSKACYACPLNRSHCDREHCIAGDGIQRTIVVVNRTLPGPSIQVCLGDEVEVALENAMPEEGASLHWHGLHQTGTPHADGVPFVTQCPVTPGSTFTYVFNASTPGTHFWHSHSGLQRGDGNFGALIVRVPKELDPHAELYDTDIEDHFIQILDWGHQLGVVTFVSHHHGNGDNKPSSILVNGRGRFRPFPADAPTTGNRSGPPFLPYPVEAGVRNKLRNTTYTPVSVFKVKRGVRHRFRLINAGFLNCPIQLSVDNHTLLVISSDGGDVEPVKVDSLVSYAGERFDFILVPEWQNDNDNGVEIKQRKFWARFRGLMDCDERFTSAHQVAVVEYEIDEPEGVILDFNLIDEDDPPGEVSYAASDRKGLVFNALNVGAGAEGSHSVAELHAVGMSKPMPDDPLLKPKADVTFYLGYDFYGKDNPIYHVPNQYGFHQVLDDRQRLQTPQLNHISLRIPSFPLLTQRDLLDEGGADLPSFCNESSLAAEGKNCSSQDFCHCTHLLNVPLGAVVELILIDEGAAYDANHPFHLHGHAFRVLGMGRIGPSVTVDTVKALDRLGYIQRRTGPLKPALKDTVTVPDGGYTLVRFHATNPGYWLFHCHLGFHVELGMALIFKVGEHKDFAPVPPKFPQCGSWTPSRGDSQVVQPKSVNKHLEDMKLFEKSSGGGGLSHSSGSINFHPHWRLNLSLLFIIFLFSIRHVMIT